MAAARPQRRPPPLAHGVCPSASRRQISPSAGWLGAILFRQRELAPWTEVGPRLPREGLPSRSRADRVLIEWTRTDAPHLRRRLRKAHAASLASPRGVLTGPGNGLRLQIHGFTDSTPSLPLPRRHSSNQRFKRSENIAHRGSPRPAGRARARALSRGRFVSDVHVHTHDTYTCARPGRTRLPESLEGTLCGPHGRSLRKLRHCTQAHAYTHCNRHAHTRGCVGEEPVSEPSSSSGGRRGAASGANAFPRRSVSRSVITRAAPALAARSAGETARRVRGDPI